jgi:hypothetical protein
MRLLRSVVSFPGDSGQDCKFDLNCQGDNLSRLQQVRYSLVTKWGLDYDDSRQWRVQNGDEQKGIRLVYNTVVTTNDAERGDMNRLTMSCLECHDLYTSRGQKRGLFRGNVSLRRKSSSCLFRSFEYLSHPSVFQVARPSL